MEIYDESGFGSGAGISDPADDGSEVEIIRRERAIAEDEKESPFGITARARGYSEFIPTIPVVDRIPTDYVASRAVGGKTPLEGQ